VLVELELELVERWGLARGLEAGAVEDALLPAWLGRGEAASFL